MELNIPLARPLPGTSCTTNHQHAKKASISMPKKSSKDFKSPPQFVNITDSVSLDKSSRTQVRAQVMRDYHRRRVQKVDGKDTSKDRSPALSAKAQTRKFRLGGETPLRPWVPVKSEKKKEKKVPENANVGRKKLGQKAHDKRQLETQDDGLDNLSFGDIVPTNFDIIDFDDDDPGFEFFEDDTIDNLAAEQWLSNLDFSLQKSTLNHSPAAGVLDPFAAMSLLITPRTQTLLHYYFNLRLQSSWLMMPMRKGLFSLALHDAALFHTFLSHYVASYNARFKLRDTAEGLFHRTMAIKLVNERLSDQSQEPSDGTIAAVANMAAYECSNGSISSVIVHWNGLEKMVNMRGGLHNGGFAPHVQRLLGWTDFHYANALLQKPRFPPLDIPTTGKCMTNPHLAMSLPDRSSSPSPGLPLGGLDTLLSEIRDLSKTLQIVRQKATMPPENIWYSDKIYYLQRQLFEIIYSPQHTGPSMDSAYAIAALMYCGHCLRDIPFTFEVMAKSVTRLKIAIDEFELFNSRVNERLFWAVALGGVASEGKQERAWYLTKFRGLCEVLGLKNWESAKPLLESLLWQPELDVAGNRLWEDANLDPPQLSLLSGT